MMSDSILPPLHRPAACYFDSSVSVAQSPTRDCRYSVGQSIRPLSCGWISEPSSSRKADWPLSISLLPLRITLRKAETESTSSWDSFLGILSFHMFIT